MKKCVAVFAATDGSGGAGLLADCRAIAKAGCRPLAVATGVSAQNLDAFFGLWQVPPSVVIAQFAALSCMPVAAVKIGMLAGNAAAVGKCLRQIAPAPVVWDPVIAATAPATIAPPANNTKPKKASRFCAADAGCISARWYLRQTGFGDGAAIGEQTCPRFAPLPSVLPQIPPRTFSY